MKNPVRVFGIILSVSSILLCAVATANYSPAQAMGKDKILQVDGVPLPHGPHAANATLIVDGVPLPPGPHSANSVADGVPLPHGPHKGNTILIADGVPLPHGPHKV